MYVNYGFTNNIWVILVIDNIVGDSFDKWFNNQEK